MDLYDQIVDPRLLVRRLNIAAINLVDENNAPEELPKGAVKDQLSLFDDAAFDTEDEKKAREQRAIEEAQERKERKIQKATLALQEKYGTNAVLKGTNFMEGGTTIERNAQIGGHRSGAEGFTREKKKQEKKLLTMNRDNFYEMFYEKIELAGINNPKDERGAHRITPYSCRHTYGTEAVKLGAHPAVIQKMLRHSNTKMQEKYTHLGSEEVHEIANMMNR